MTAEVAILNRSAVAIAADSAVTLGLSGRKVYNTANKLFALSVTEPVAIMIYGSGSFGPIPWETVIKEYRRALGSTSFGTIEEYAASFIEHLNSLVSHISKEDQRDFVYRRTCWELDELLKAVDHAVRRTQAGYSPPDEDELAAVVLDRIEARIDQLKNLGYVDRFTASLMGLWVRDVLGDWSTFVDGHWQGPTLSSEAKRRLRILARTSLRVAEEWPESSGVVVAGFGTEQLFPALSSYIVDGVIASKVRTRHDDSVRIGEHLTASILSFAQEDMVETFMNGMDPDYRDAIDEFVDTTIEMFLRHFSHQVRSLISPSDYSHLTTTLSQAKSQVIDHFRGQLSTLLDQQNYQPIMTIVASLPKDGLAEMAETLVNLTSFKRRVTPTAETVGGPIDVAVISKGDGLVWIKRKHYFAPELNIRYLDRVARYRNHAITGGAS